MCFLRPARGFGWLDPNFSKSAAEKLLQTPPRSKTNRIMHSQKRRFAAEKWGMRGRCPSQVYEAR